MPRHETYELVAHSLKPRTQKEYLSALKDFLEHCKNNDISIYGLENVDFVLCDYIHQVFRAPGRDGKGHANKVICAIKHFLPEVKDKLHLSHKSMTGWAKIVPIQQKTPCPHDLALAYAYYLRATGFSDMCCAVLLSYDCHLRLEELRSLSKRQILFRHDRVTLLLQDTKFGIHQSVDVRFKLVVILLKRLFETISDLDTPVFGFTGEQWRKQIHKISAEHFPMTDIRFKITPHSFRHGGATRDFMLGRLDIQGVMDRGRWSNQKTLRSYIQVGTSLIVQVAVPDTAKQAIKEISKRSSRYFGAHEVKAGWEEFWAES